MALRFQLSLIKHHILSLIQLKAVSQMLFSLKLKGYSIFLVFTRENFILYFPKSLRKFLGYVT